MEKEYKKDISRQKPEYWIKWLEELDNNDIWIANKVVTMEPTDGGAT